MLVETDHTVAKTQEDVPYGVLKDSLKLVGVELVVALPVDGLLLVQLCAFVAVEQESPFPSDHQRGSFGRQWQGERDHTDRHTGASRCLLAVDNGDRGNLIVRSLLIDPTFRFRRLAPLVFCHRVKRASPSTEGVIVGALQQLTLHVALQRRLLLLLHLVGIDHIQLILRREVIDPLYVQ